MYSDLTANTDLANNCVYTIDFMAYYKKSGVILFIIYEDV